MRWRTFCGAVTDLAEALGCQMVVTLGALLADVPHTRPVHITGLSSDEKLVEHLGVQSGTYEGPTGIVGVLHDAFAEAGVPSASLWAAVPHYVASTPSPKAALALIERATAMLSTSLVTADLEVAAADYERQVGLAVQSDPDIQAFVERLEQAAESDEEVSTEEVPSGDVIAREFQRFLRQRGRESK